MHNFMRMNKLCLTSYQRLELFELACLYKIGTEDCMRHTSHQGAIALRLRIKRPRPLNSILCSPAAVTQRLNRRLSGLPDIKRIGQVPVTVLLPNHVEIELFWVAG